MAGTLRSQHGLSMDIHTGLITARDWLSRLWAEWRPGRQGRPRRNLRRAAMQRASRRRNRR